MARPGPTNEQIANALIRCKGMVYVAADLLKTELGECSPNTIKSRMKQYAWLRELVHDQDELVNDVAELKLFEAINARESWAVQYRLTRKAKHRGYGDERTIKGDPEQPIVVKTITAIIPAEVADDGDATAS